MILLTLKESNMTESMINILDSLDESIREEFEERAAILEYDANLPRVIAEEQAFKLVVSKYLNSKE
jgi:hypothetical protein